jgi:hypothetical protein
MGWINQNLNLGMPWGIIITYGRDKDIEIAAM